MAAELLAFMTAELGASFGRGRVPGMILIVAGDSALAAGDSRLAASVAGIAGLANALTAIFAGQAAGAPVLSTGLAAG